jgi:hypothetical protein
MQDATGDRAPAPDKSIIKSQLDLAAGLMLLAIALIAYSARSACALARSPASARA